MEMPFRVTTAPATGAVSVLTSTRIVARGGSCENTGSRVVRSANEVRQSTLLTCGVPSPSSLKSGIRSLSSVPHMTLSSYGAFARWLAGGNFRFDLNRFRLNLAHHVDARLLRY